MKSFGLNLIRAFALILGLIAGSVASAQQTPPANPYQQLRPSLGAPPPQQAPAPQQYRPPVSGPVAPQQPAQPASSSPPANGPAAMSPNDRAAATILIKNTLIAVNQGNLTGNFTVLRDLASPGFRNRNSAGDLANIFQSLRQKKVDLSPVVVLDPLIAPPQVTKEGLLLIEGYFPSNPLRIVFKLGYIKSDTGGWMIDAVSVGVTPAEATSQNTQPAPATSPQPTTQRRPG